MMKKKTTRKSAQVCFTIEPSMLSKLDKEAAKQSRNRSGMISKIIKDFFQKGR